MNTQKGIECDVVVVGAGGSGLAAALTAKKGAHVIIVEKLPSPGGTSRFAEGMFAVESTLQATLNVLLTKDEAFKNHMLGTHWRANAPLVRAFINKSADTVQWLQALGVEFTGVISLWPGGPRTWHMVKGGGKALVDALFKTVQEHGIQVILGVTFTAFLTDEPGHITGILTRDKDGNTLQIKSKAVILSSGGFTSNQDMVKEYTNAPPGARPVIDLQQTGEPIKRAWETGASPHGESVLLSIPCVTGELPDSHLWAAGIQPQLWVNKRGTRFCDESVYFQFPYSANALGNQPDGVMYCIFDQQTKQDMIKEGIPIGLGVFVPPGSTLTKLDEGLERGINNGNVFKADSIKGLSEKLEVDPVVFQSTVDEYNSYCEKQHDTLFAKDPQYLQPVNTPAFYAVKCMYHIFTTLGGIRINHRTEVLDHNQDVIPGLYATGNCAGGLYGEDYEIFSSGGALSFALSSGRIAGEAVLEYLGK